MLSAWCGDSCPLWHGLLAPHGVPPFAVLVSGGRSTDSAKPRLQCGSIQDGKCSKSTVRRNNGGIPPKPTSARSVVSRARVV
jgi:hypothetical protein